MKKTLLALAVAGAAVTAQADVKLSGHVNYTFGDLEDFTGNEDFSVNNANTSASRFRIIATKKVGSLTYGLREEFGLETGGADEVNIRFNEVWLKGAFGKVSLGQGSEAGDGSAEHDFSGTYVLNNANYNSWGINDRTKAIDGGRVERLRYDSPKLGGIASVAVSLADNDNANISLDVGGSNWKAGIFHESKEADDSDEIGASIAGKIGHFTLAGQWGTKDETASGANDDEDFSRYIVGYRAGATSVALDFSTSEVDGGTDSDFETIGLSFVYRPTKGVELYAGVREIDSKRAGGVAVDDGDETAVLFGSRVKF